MEKIDKKVLILTGPGGSGKTTIADLLVERCGFTKIDGDRLDTEFFPNGGQWFPENLDKLKLAHKKIFDETKKEFINSGKNTVLDYIIFGDYSVFLEMFKREFGNNLEIKVLFPTQEETVKRDKERECWTAGVERISEVRAEFEKVRGLIDNDSFIDTTNQTPVETVKKYFSNFIYE
ncbi:MAG: AAA family ATPase [Candidatus Magasanikbacteria bacterium]|nr:AAA family ATPase [Candidatus Magasanikbacteria bacterium]